MKPKSHIPWHEKLDRSESRLTEDPRGRGLMLIPGGKEVDSLLRRVRKGELVTVEQLRDRLAADHGADLACPLVTGMMLRISAEAAEEDLASGRKRVAPYWRVLRSDGSLNPKFPGGVEVQAEHLAAEGFELEPARGKSAPRVREWRTHLKKDL